MTNQPETPSYDAGVYQLQATDPCQGATSSAQGVLNQPLLSLANRTGWLKAQVQALLSALTGYAPLNSPAFSGTPTVPTPAVGDNSGEIPNTAWVREQMGALSFPGRLIAIRTFGATTGSPTYVPSPGTAAILIFAAAAGGGGGGVPATDSSHVSVASGGGSGAHCWSFKNGGFSGANYGVGAGGAGTNGTGNTGGDTYFADISLHGGQGGSVNTQSNTSPFIANTSPGGTISTGGNILNALGQTGDLGFYLGNNIAASGNGASGPWGGKGGNNTTSIAGYSNGGVPAGGPGAGGGGALGTSGSPAKIGGQGGDGIIIIYEFSAS